MSSPWPHAHPLNAVPDGEQAISKLILHLATAAVEVASYDSLRSVAGAAGAETTLTDQLIPGQRVSTFEVGATAGLATLASGSSIWLYDVASSEYQEFKIKSAAGTTVTLTGTHEVKHRFDGPGASGALVSATPPFDDLFAFDLSGLLTTSTRALLVFHDADSTGLTVGTLAAFDYIHVESIPRTPALNEIQERGILLPKCISPCRYVSLLGDAALDGSAGGGTDILNLTLHRKRNTVSLFGTI
jgi:hypothetical protein